MDTASTASAGIVRAAIMVALTTVLVFGTWCLADWIYVRVPSGREFVRATEGVLIPLMCLGVFFGHWRLQPGAAGAFTSILTTLLSCTLAVVLIFYVGIPFHLWIGGSL